MKPPKCPNCTRADADWRHDHYTRGCPDCDVRKLARAPNAYRQAALDHTLKHRGPDAERCLRDKLSNEIWRIQALKGRR